MAKRKSAKKGTLVFILFLCLYALLFLGATAYGLDFLWEYLDAYEMSRPKHGIESYMEKLSPAYVLGHCDELINSVDASVQSEDSCKRAILDALGTEFSYVKILSETTDTKITYQLRAGKTVIGAAVMTPQGESVHGYTAWAVTEDRFDLSFLLQPEITVTAPSHYTVTVNGTVLTSDHLLEGEKEFPLLKEFYGTYDLPTVVTYQAGPFLSSPSVEVLDSQGNPVAITEETDWDSLLPLCSKDENAAIENLANAFLLDYVAFTTVKGGDTEANYDALIDHLLPNGDLQKRMYAAIDGLSWVSDRGASLVDVQFLCTMPFGEGRYLCDLTYKVSARDLTGQVQTESHVKLLLLQTETGWYVESLISC